ncbi:MAG: murein biosynthesis integral membrane protein MurJ [Oligoflexales bacterium]|nr:murein biosynthesis integral membrane protein MurJ [Oligoflexales bacterium]
MQIYKSSFWFSLGTLVSRLTGLLRESITAALFGAGTLLDSFLIANRIPNLLRDLLAEGALGSSFTKIYAELWENDKARALRFFKDSLKFFSYLMLFICILGIIFSKQLVLLTTMFLDSSETKQIFFIHNTIGLTKILFPFIGLMTVASIFSGVLHREGRFFLSAVSPVTQNMGYILGALYFSSLMSLAPDWWESLIAERTISGLALGVLFGGVAYAWTQYITIPKTIRQAALVDSPPQSLLSVLKSSDLRRMLAMMSPMLIAGSSGQINVLVNSNFATSLGEGAVSWLNCSFRLLQLPIGIFAVAVSSVALPSLTKEVAIAKQFSQNKNALSQKLEEALGLMLWLMTFCWAFIFANSLAIIQIIYQYGKFSYTSSLATAESLYCYSFSLIGYGLLKVLTSFYYAIERTKYAMKISLFSIGLNATANYLLVDRFRHQGLAMTASLVISMNALFLLVGLRKEKLAWRYPLVFRCLFFLASSFFVSVVLQNVCTRLLEASILSALGLYSGLFLSLSLSAGITVFVFIAGSALFLKRSPFVLLRQLSRKRRHHVSNKE